MKFSVILIEVNDTKDQKARESLYSNCTHVAKGYWLFEGDTDTLNTGIDFNVVDEAAIESYGDLSGRDIRSMVLDNYNIDRCFLF